MSTSCASPQWHTVYVLQPNRGCPGDWQQVTFEGGSAGELTVCGRGRRAAIAQSSAILAQGWLYSKVRGQLTARMMGSPDAFRPESWRGLSTIDDAYMDGVAFARWGSGGRTHVASYAAGTSYSARAYSFYQNGNCLCHGGSELPPGWLGDNYYCDSGLRLGGGSCPVGGPGETTGCNSELACSSLHAENAACSGRFKYWSAHWYTADEASDIFGTTPGYLCHGERYATAEDFPGRPFGSFLYEVPDGEYTNDPIEGRVMAGQSSGTIE